MSAAPADRRPDRRRAAGAACAAVALLAGLAAVTACTEDAIVGPGPEGSEGAETVEVVLAADQMAVWRDTAFAGYAVPADAPFLLAADGGSFRARPLLKYRIVPDSVTVDSVTLAVESYGPASLELAVDTADTELPEAGATLRLRGLLTDWTGVEATWDRAADGTPWGTPGGDLGPELASLDLAGITDSALAGGLTVPVDSSAADSLLRDWAAGRGGLGAAVVLESAGGEARLRLDDAVLEMGVQPAGLDTTVTLQVRPNLTADPSTFIHDPPAPDREGRLRLGGLPAHRIYFRFVPPDSAAGVPLRQGTVNRAELVFLPRGAPQGVFALDVDARASLVELVSDPFETGPRTPLAGEVASRTLQPDSLAAGRPLRLPFTALMGRWAAAPDSFGTFHLGVRMRPDAQDLGFWEFGAEEDAPELRPFVRLLVTPATTFDLP